MRCFSAAALPAILSSLDEAGSAGSDFARSTAQAIRSKSPTSLAIALRQMQIGAKLDIGGALQTEFRIASRIARGHDFYEGVRAVIVDKDNRPRWNFASIESSSRSAVDPYSRRSLMANSTLMGRLVLDEALARFVRDDGI